MSDFPQTPTSKTPSSIWNRPIKLNFKDFFKALAKVSISTIGGRWDLAAKEFGDAVTSMGLKQEPSELAGYLLQRALSQATLDLLKEHLHDFAQKNESQLQELLEKIEAIIGDIEMELDESIFEKPRDLPILGPYQKQLTQWLKLRELTEHKPETIAARLPSYFVYALHQELGKHRDRYQPLVNSIKTEVSDAWTRERTWHAYRISLNREMDQPLFGDCFSLKQIFIWPNAYYVKKNKEFFEDHEVQPGKRKEERRVVKLKDELDDWLKQVSMAINTRT